MNMLAMWLRHHGVSCQGTYLLNLIITTIQHFRDFQDFVRHSSNQRERGLMIGNLACAADLCVTDSTTTGHSCFLLELDLNRAFETKLAACSHHLCVQKGDAAAAATDPHGAVNSVDSG